MSPRKSSSISGHSSQGQCEDFETLYLERLAKRCAELEPHVPLDEVYVMLQAVSHFGPAASEKAPEHPLTAERLNQAGLTSGEVSSQSQQLLREDPPPRAVSLGETLKQATHLVILGEPGAGKSTTLQFIALCFARRREPWAEERLQLNEERIPIWLSLGELVTLMEEQEKSPQLEYALAWFINDRHLRLRDEQAAVNCLFAWRDDGKLLLLLDGLDEISHDQRSRMIEQLSSFVENNRANRVVLTSRLTGYTSAGAPFKEYTLKPIDKAEETRPFLKKWMKINRREWDETTLERKSDDLWRQLQAQESLKRVLTNPLILRMAAENYARTGTVARHRAELYQQYWETLWSRAVERGAPKDLKSACFAALEALAFHLHTGGAKDGQTLERILREGTASHKPNGDAKGTPLLPILNQKLGLLVHGREGYRFSHPTFQEYGVARYFARAWQENPSGCRRFLHLRLHHPAWREPILLLGGCLSCEHGPSEVGKLAEWVLNACSPGEPVLLRDLRLSARLIGEASPVPPETLRVVKKQAESLLSKNGFREN